MVACILTGHLSALEIQGHRGARGQYPENTLPGFMAAIEGGVDTLELDLMMTGDNQIVIYHDFALNPDLCTHLNGKPLRGSPLIAQMSLVQVKRIDCGSKQNPLFPTQVAVKGVQIPTLRELLYMIRTHPLAQDVKLNLEIKINPYSTAAHPSRAFVAQRVLDEVRASGLEDRVSYSSFDLEVLKEIRTLDSQARLGFIFNSEWLQKKWLVKTKNWLPFVIASSSKIRVEILSIEHSLLTAERIQTLHRFGFRVIPWTINDLKLSQELIKMGVDGIITDYPSDFVKRLKPQLKE